MELFFSKLTELIAKGIDKKGIFIIGVDGCGGSGKSVFAKTLESHYRPSVIIEMDDFYHTSMVRNSLSYEKTYGALFDWQRLRSDVLKPLNQLQLAYYYPYDWDNDQLGELVLVEPRGLIIIEGVYTTRTALRDYYDLSIWVDCPYELRLKRGLERDGEEGKSNWIDLWMPKEEEYMRAEAPMQHADIKIDGSSPSYGKYWIKDMKFLSSLF